MIKKISTDKAPAAIGPYCQAMAVNGMLFTSGQLGLDPATGDFAGDNVQYHASGVITFPILGTAAKQEDKLAFDPDRSKRRKFYDEVCELFSDYNVFVGGSSSFDMAPKPYNKYHALAKYCEELGIAHNEAVFVGDDYGLGGNDESVYKSDFNFICVDDYRDFENCVKELL